MKRLFFLFLCCASITKTMENIQETVNPDRPALEQVQNEIVRLTDLITQIRRITEPSNFELLNILRNRKSYLKAIIAAHQVQENGQMREPLSEYFLKNDLFFNTTRSIQSTRTLMKIAEEEVESQA